MPEPKQPLAITAIEVAAKTSSNYPAEFATQVAGREKRVLGNLFGLTNFGVNHTTLLPGAASALRHYHQTQDEFIYILSGHPTLVTDEGETVLSPGMCAGFKAGNANGHQLVNRSNEPVIYLEIGDRSAGDAVTYPDDDLRADYVSGKWQFAHKDGTPY